MTGNSKHPLVLRNDIAGQLHLAQLALDNSLDSILIHDTSGRLVYFNEAAAASVGCTREEFASLPPWGFAGEASDEERQSRLAVIRDAGEMTFLSERECIDGSRHIFEVHSRWVENDDGPLVVAVTHDVTERLRAETALEHLAFHDPLTGLANRALFDDRLEIAIAGARRHGNILGVAFIDVDDFKDINDSLGHEAGDRVLIALARRLEKAARSEDTVARLGGDEFVFIFPRLSSTADLAGVSEKLRSLLSDPVETAGQRLNVTASFGTALFDTRSDDARSLMMRADVAMYAAKRERSESRVQLADRTL